CCSLLTPLFSSSGRHTRSPLHRRYGNRSVRLYAVAVRPRGGSLFVDDGQQDDPSVGRPDPGCLAPEFRRREVDVARPGGQGKKGTLSRTVCSDTQVGIQQGSDRRRSEGRGTKDAGDRKSV